MTTRPMTDGEWIVTVITSAMIVGFVIVFAVTFGVIRYLILAWLVVIHLLVFNGALTRAMAVWERGKVRESR